MDHEMHPDDSTPATKGDLRALQAATKGDLRTLRVDLRQEIREEMRELMKPVVVLLTRHSAELADIRGYMKEHLVTREEFHSRMDAFAGRVDDFAYGDAKSRSRLDDHERRIGALEKRA